MQKHRGPSRNFRQEVRQAGWAWWLVVALGAVAGVTATGMVLRALGFGQP